MKNERPKRWAEHPAELKLSERAQCVLNALLRTQGARKAAKTLGTVESVVNLLAHGGAVRTAQARDRVEAACLERLKAGG